MQYLRPTCYDRFFCAGEHCPAQCPAPVDMTWTRTLGSLCESGLKLACPRAAELLLLPQEPMRFVQETDRQGPVSSPGLPPETLELLLDARRTLDLLIRDRTIDLRSRAVLAVTYCVEFEPMITDKTRYAFDELDWGFTEQTIRQFQVLTRLTGQWEEKRSDLCHLLEAMENIGDTVLQTHVGQTLALMRDLDGEEYRLLREEFDRYMAPREHLFENLLMYCVHRYFLSTAEALTVAPGARRMAVSFVLLRAMCARVWRETGRLTDNVFLDLCWHFARSTGDEPGGGAAWESLLASPLGSWDRLQRLLWR